MVNFDTDVVARGNAARDFIAQTGGLPEISRASVDFLTAIAQTREEVEAATFARRFSVVTSDYFQTMTRSGEASLTSRARESIEAEGEAGHKRESLRAELASIEYAVTLLVAKLVEVRCDLVVSQQEFVAEDESVDF